MYKSQLELIRQYCDTTGIRLSSDEKDLLCKVLENPDYFDGYKSEVYEEKEEGKDFRGTWNATTLRQYRINVNPKLSIDLRYQRSVDGDVDNRHGDWDTAWHYTDTRDIIRLLKDIEDELY